MRVPPRPPSQASQGGQLSGASDSARSELRQLGEGVLEAAKREPLDPEAALGLSRSALQPLRGALLEAAIRLLEREPDDG